MEGDEVVMGVPQSPSPTREKPAYCGKSEAINTAIRDNFLDHNFNVISQTVSQKLLKYFLKETY